MTTQAGVPDPVATALGNGLVLLGSLGSRRLLGALRIALKDPRSGGGTVPPDVVRLLDVLTAAVQQPGGFRGETDQVSLGQRQAASAAVSPLLVVADPIGCVEAAALLRCSPQWIRALCRRGAFRTAQQRGGSWWIERGEVAARVNEPGSVATSTGKAS